MADTKPKGQFAHESKAAHLKEEVRQRNAAVPILENLYNEMLSKSPSGILSSKQPEVVELSKRKDSPLLNVIQPEFSGVKRWYLPIAPAVPTADQGTHRYYAYYGLWEPNAEMPLHSTALSTGELYVVLSGSLFFLNVEHTVGDWIWVPPHKEYSLRAGPLGAYCLTTWPATESTVEDVKNPPNPELQKEAEKLIQEVDTWLDTTVNHGNTTSHDPLVVEAFAKIGDPFPNKWPGIKRTFFPFAYRAPELEYKYDGRYLVYIALIDPDTDITHHTHPIEKLADKRVILSGSITSEGKELTASRMAWIPAASPYSFTTGKTGALTLLISCYV